MMHLKQSTASQSVVIGPFVDSTDGNTAETGLTITNTDIRLSKNGADIAAKNSGGGTHDELGYYTITLDATDTNTVGRLQLMAHESGALPVYHEYEVLEEAVYDNLYGSAAVGPLPANSDGAVLTEAGGTGDHLTAIAAELAKVPKSDSNVTFNATALASINAECDTALTDYDGPTDTEMVAAFTEIKGATWATTDTLEAIRDRGDAAWITGSGSGLDAAGVRAAVGLASANLDTQIGDIPTVAELNARTIVSADYFDPAADTVARVTLCDTTTTNTDMRGTDSAATEAKQDIIDTNVDTLVARIVGTLLAGNHTAQSGDAFARLGAPAGASVSADIAAQLTTVLTESYAANGAQGSATQLLYAIHQMLMSFAISGTALTARKLDNSTEAFVVTLDDDTNPSETSRA